MASYAHFLIHICALANLHTVQLGRPIEWRVAYWQRHGSLIFWSIAAGSSTRWRFCVPCGCPRCGGNLGGACSRGSSLMDLLRGRPRWTFFLLTAPYSMEILLFILDLCLGVTGSWLTALRAGDSTFPYRQCFRIRHGRGMTLGIVAQFRYPSADHAACLEPFHLCPYGISGYLVARGGAGNVCELLVLLKADLPTG